MPRVRIPETDESRLRLLATTTRTAAGDAARTPGYLPAPLATSIAGFIDDTPGAPPRPGFATQVRTLTAARAAASTEVGQADAADGTLETYLRDFWDGLKRRTFRLGHPVAVLNFFDLPQDGALPAFGARAERHGWAQKLLDGERAAVAAGYPPMSNPTAAEVAAKLTDAQREAAEITPKTREEEQALTAVRAARPTAAQLCADVIDELRHNTRRLPPGTSRDIMRSYGVEFEFLPGEPADAPPATAAPAPASTTPAGPGPSMNP